MIVLALDPGKINFGFAVLDNRDGIDLLLCGRLGSSITDVAKDVMTEAKILERRIQDKIDRFSPDTIICERYMSRGKNSFNNEVVNIAIGVILSIALKNDIPIQLIGSMTWKNHMQHHYGNNEMGSMFAKAYSDHASDAIGMGVWYFDKTKPNTLKQLIDTWPLRTCDTCCRLECKKKKVGKYCRKWEKIPSVVKPKKTTTRRKK
jgi:Holliday junction resolvasome RuvABC endonuclease subunit